MGSRRSLDTICPERTGETKREVTIIFRKIQAVLFDMDGVLVDSEQVITEAGILALQEWGITAVAEDFHEFTGMGEDRFIGGVAEKHGVPYIPAMKRRAYAIYTDVVDRQLVRFPETIPILETLRAAGLDLVLASAADRVKVDANLRAAAINPSFFRAILSGNDVACKKPAPDIYLMAAQQAGCPARHCVVVEDALSGLRAAHNAGMPCICVTTSFSAETLQKNSANYICRDIGGVPNGIFCLENLLNSTGG